MRLETTIDRTSPRLSRPPIARVWGRRGVAITVAIAAAFYGIIIVGRLALHSWDPTVFVVAGASFYDQASSPQPLMIRSRFGYDGQYYYRFALHPLSDQRTAYGINVDNPAYRGQRMLYPILAHLLALGRATWVPWSMIVVNYLAICALALSAALFAQRLGWPAVYGLAMAFLPGVLFGLARDLADPLAISLMVCSLFLLHTRRIGYGAAILALAILTRETMVLLAGALFLHFAWTAIRKESTWTNAMFMLIPIGTYGAVQLMMFARCGEFPLQGGHGNLQPVPFSSMVPYVVGAFRNWAAPSLPSFISHLFLCGELLFIAELVLFAGATMNQSVASNGTKIAWLGYIFVATLFSSYIWVEDWSFLRACAELMVLSLVILMGARNERLLKISLVSIFAIWIPLALRAVVTQ